jgi:hypothetical protein
MNGLKILFFLSEIESNVRIKSSESKFELERPMSNHMKALDLQGLFCFPPKQNRIVFAFSALIFTAA